MDTPGSAGAVTVYWRPGCPYCSRLRRDLRRIGLAAAEVNIWDDPSGAATVRSVTGGDETVPTVVVGGTGLVNPSARSVLGAVRQVAPDLLPDGWEAAARRQRVLLTAQWIVIAGIVAGSIAAEAAGRSGISWALDAAALAVYAAFRVARRLPAPRTRCFRGRGCGCPKPAGCATPAARDQPRSRGPSVTPVALGLQFPDCALSWGSNPARNSPIPHWRRPRRRCAAQARGGDESARKPGSAFCPH